MTHHPTAAELDCLLLGSLAKEQVRPVVTHLLRGCASCQERLIELAGKRRADRRAPSPLMVEGDQAYDTAIERALATAQEEIRVQEALAVLAEQGLQSLIEGPQRLQGVPVVQALLRHSWNLRHDDPAQAVQMAWHAIKAVDTLSGDSLGEERISDLRCQAYATLGNACRVTDDLAKAESHFQTAFHWYAEGTGNELLLARLTDLQASLHMDQRRVDMALSGLDTVYAIYLAHGEDHLAGRALISKGIYTGNANDPEGAIRLLNQGLAQIDTRNDPDLTFRAIHSMAWFMLDLGRFREAQALVRQNAWRYERQAFQADLLRLGWLEGRAAAGLGDLNFAERALREAIEGFEAAGRHYDAALASLDLAVVYLRQGRAADTQTTVLQAADIFLSLRIGREALSAVLVLQSAFKQELMAQALLEKSARFLRRAEYDPTVSFKAWFL